MVLMFYYEVHLYRWDMVHLGGSRKHVYIFILR